jgi:hypothetical protein
MNKRMPIYNEMSGHFDDTYVSRHHESDMAIHRIVQRGAPACLVVMPETRQKLLEHRIQLSGGLMPPNDGIAEPEKALRRNRFSITVLI